MPKIWAPNEAPPNKLKNLFFFVIFASPRHDRAECCRHYDVIRQYHVIIVIFSKAYFKFKLNTQVIGYKNRR